jgi:hypothetical protein
MNAVNVTTRAIAIDEPNDVSPLTLGSAVADYIYPSTAARYTARTHVGSQSTLIVKLKLASGWHLSGNSTENGADQPTVDVGHIQISLPNTGRWSSEWCATVSYEAGRETEMVLTRDLYFNGPAETVKLSGSFRYEACHETECLKPAEAPFESLISVEE